MLPTEWTMLIIDGNRVSRKVYGKLLSQHFHDSCALLETETIERALHFLTSTPVHCILMDYRLPDGNALIFLERMKATLQYPYLPVVIMAGEGDELIAVEAMKSGAQDYLVKGNFSQSGLVQAVLNAIEKVDLLAELERRRTLLERTNAELSRTNHQLKETQQQLVEAAHRAGMAEIATGVMHNIGNLMNSVSTSVDQLLHQMLNSKLRSFKQAVELLESFEPVLAELPKGRQLLDFFKVLERAREEEMEKIKSESAKIGEKVRMIRNDIVSQSSYVETASFVEDVHLETLLNDTIRLQQANIERQDIVLVRVYEDVPLVKISKTKLMHVVNILIKNAVESFHDEHDPDKKRKIKISLKQESDSSIQIRIADNGKGIESERLERVFNYGYSTKQGAGGVGLHVAANAMTEMGGTLSLESQGLGKGVTATVWLPEKRNFAHQV